MDAPDEVADLIASLKKKGTESDRSVHFYFPIGLDNGQQNHIIVDAFGFAVKFEDSISLVIHQIFETRGWTAKLPQVNA